MSAFRKTKRRRKATLSVIDATQPICVECGKRGQLVSGAKIYPHRPDLHGKTFWLCQCGAYVGCHPGTAIPLGKPAGAATRAARSRAHAAFDPLWKAKANRNGTGFKRARTAAYKWLADQLGIEREACHIGWMDAAMAERVVAICAPYQPKRRAA